MQGLPEQNVMRKDRSDSYILICITTDGISIVDIQKTEKSSYFVENLDQGTSNEELIPRIFIGKYNFYIPFTLYTFTVFFRFLLFSCGKIQ